MTTFLNKIYKSVLSSVLWLVGLILFTVVLFAKTLFIINEMLIPRGLRELVPHLNLWRKYFVYTSNLFSTPQQFEIIKLEEEIDEVIIKEERINKAYPIQRGVGETYDHLLIVIVIIWISIEVIQSKATSFDGVIVGFLDKYGLEDVNPIVIAIFAIIFSTVMGILSSVAMIFGPVYAIFHRSSLRMVKLGSYRWSSFYQKLEDLFALPYIASKASFSFFDSPPISQETFEDFSIDLYGDLDNIRKRITNILNLAPTALSERIKTLYLQFVSSDFKDRIDMSLIEDPLARAFSLEIWQKENSIFPWLNNPGLKLFANRKDMTKQEAKQTLQFVTNKLQDKFVSRHFYSSILITGALKGIMQAEQTSGHELSDLDYNQIAYSLALGAQRYILDHFSKRSFFKRWILRIRNFGIGLFVPFYELITILISYVKHVSTHNKSIFSKNWTQRVKYFFNTRFKEIQQRLRDRYVHAEREIDDESKQIARETFKMVGKSFLFIAKVVLALPLSLYYITKTFYTLIALIWRKRKPEERKKKAFEKEVAKESLYCMYDEIYSKFILKTYYYS